MKVEAQSLRTGDQVSLGGEVVEVARAVLVPVRPEVAIDDVRGYRWRLPLHALVEVVARGE